MGQNQWSWKLGGEGSGKGEKRGILGQRTGGKIGKIENLKNLMYWSIVERLGQK